jgi:uncharacterized membrane protein YdjX (TVP38/TMEM64 family)
VRISRSPHAGRKLLAPALAVALAVVAFLLFTWPLVREPHLHVVLAFVHVLGAWAAVVAMLGWISRRPTAEDASTGERDG